MRYTGSILALLTLVALAWAGSIDNSATRSYVDSGDAVVSAQVAAGDTASSNYTKAVALVITNAFHAGDAAGSQYVAQVVATNVAADSAKLGGIAAASYVTNSGATINGQAISNGAAITVSSAQSPLTNNVNAAGYSITNLLTVASTAAVSQVAFRLPFGAFIEWGDGTTTNFVRMTAVSAGAVHWISQSNSAVAVTNIMQVNP